jgi:membrane protein YfhO
LPWALLLPFFTAVLAGLGWDAIGERTVRRGGVIVLTMVAAALFARFGTPASALAAGAAVVVLGLAARAGGARPWLAAAILLVALGDLWVALPYRRGADPLPPLPESATTKALLAALRADAGLPRFLGAAEAGTGIALRERVYTIAGLEDSLMPRALRRIVDHFGLGIAGDDMPLHPAAFRLSKPLLDLMGVAWVSGPARWAPILAAGGFAVVRAPTADAHGLWANPAALPRAFLVRRVQVARGDEAFAAVAAPEFRPRETAVVDRALPALADTPLTPGETARIIAYTPETVRVATAAQSPALLVLTDTDFPGWQATVDGAAAAIVPTDFVFRGVVVPAGDHEVVFAYRPAAVRAGLWLSVAGLAGAAVLLAAGRRRR